MKNFPPLLGRGKSGRRVVIKSADPKGANCQPVSHEELAVLGCLSGHKKHRFRDTITPIHHVLLDSGWILVNELHCILPDSKRGW